MICDVVPRWFSRLTMRRLNQTPHYRLPPMPRGINRDPVKPTQSRWLECLASVTFLDYRVPRGLPHMAALLINLMPFLRHEVPSLVHVKLIPETPGRTPSDLGKNT